MQPPKIPNFWSTLKVENLYNILVIWTIWDPQLYKEKKEKGKRGEGKREKGGRGEQRGKRKGKEKNFVSSLWNFKSNIQNKQ